ncbi:Hypothetical protein GbCGDNIH9_1693 [Granulibacter bethesdensis]|uniref:CRISPR-associated protein, Cse1 family n=1 Tax=Granulibacter bethesdensis TaxID=364410 RepID=A0AAC9P8Y1_9PROT|nr:type I-E CRISPR-associated protein Cse1/CasA [Granulibacter bethesdensis]APH54992.1 Hypothetical protein GbCGDNIH9_1693 [Granulibacter bethesdensis]APH62578.1 Hypothetical protein GbCGDNIH8_1693 [Granulibacter bethesdensis]
MHCLLSHPVFRTVIRAENHVLTLPGALAALMLDKVDSFTALRPHQQHAWHMFLAALGAIALHRADQSAIPETEEEWKDLLLDLTDQAEEPWSLIVEDLSKPAFLQPPVPEGKREVLKNTVYTPDALDILITAKNFDLKAEVAIEAGLDEWVFALVSLQTMQGYSGATKYGIARMNGGFSARPFLGLAPAKAGIGAHLRRDIRAMLAGRDKLLDMYQDYDEEGLALLWLEPWDGKTSLSLDQLDPWFIEICRRVRLFQGTDEHIVALNVGSAVARIEAKSCNGITGDFWAPIYDSEGKSFSLDARGFSYRVLCRLLFGEAQKRVARLPQSMQLLPDERDMLLVARGMVRGQGKTEGYHERIIPTQRRIIDAINDDTRRLELAEIADKQQKEIAHITSALRQGCAIVSIGGADKKPSKDDYGCAGPYTDRLEAEADAGFFETIQQRFEKGDDCKIPYLRHLIHYAEHLLIEASDSISCPVENRWRAGVRAPRVFRGMLWSQKSPFVNDRTSIFPPKEAADVRQ